MATIESAMPLARLFEEAGRSLFFVGGVVRDSLLEIERAENDLDATTDARPEQIKTLVAELAEAVWTQGERFGTIGCRIDGQIYEITTHRADSYDRESRKPVVAFGDRLEDDLLRRDFTVNAMAVEIIEPRLIDPLGGETDLRNRVLRTPLEPSVSFSDDPLRMLRAARFHAAYGLAPVPELSEAIGAMADRLAIVSAERIRMELEKLLLLPDPGPGLEMLRSTGLIPKVLPALARLDPAALALRATRVAAVECSPAHRWAALLNDPAMVGGRLRELKAAGALITDTEAILRMAAALESVESVDEPDVRRLAAMGTGSVSIEDAVDWKRRADGVSGAITDRLDDVAATLARLRTSEPDLDSPNIGLDGNQIIAFLGIEPGADVGRAMSWLREIRVNEGPRPADELKSRLAAWWANGAAD